LSSVESCPICCISSFHLGKKKRGYMDSAFYFNGLCFLSCTEGQNMRRIYFLAPNIETTHKIVDELRAEGIEDRYLHILAKRDTPLEDMPEATEFQKTDFIPAMERGAALGATTGLLAGLVGLRFAGFAIAGGPVLGILGNRKDSFVNE
ncbi:MAG: hypothetical protein Q8S52_05610, partial [Methylobacter sp.]|nr:hypothetical protein [Methylobacter sp.]